MIVHGIEWKCEGRCQATDIEMASAQLDSTQVIYGIRSKVTPMTLPMIIKELSVFMMK